MWQNYPHYIWQSQLLLQSGSALDSSSSLTLTLHYLPPWGKKGENCHIFHFQGHPLLVFLIFRGGFHPLLGLLFYTLCLVFGFCTIPKEKGHAGGTHLHHVCSFHILTFLFIVKIIKTQNGLDWRRP